MLGGVLCALGVFAPAPAAALASPYRPPAGKVFHGGTGGYQPASIQAFGRLSGRRPAVYQYFFTPGWKHPSELGLRWQRSLIRMTSSEGARAIFHLSTRREGHSNSVITPRGIARGGGDAYLLRLGSLIASTGRVVYIRLMAEMNNFNNPYCAVDAGGRHRGRAYAPVAYRQAWRRAALILRGGPVAAIDRRLRRLGMRPLRTSAGALPRPKVALLWNPFTGGLPDVRDNKPGAYWPGSRYVDWVGTDFFANSPNFRGLNRFYRDSRWRHKPFVFGEWALWGREDRRFVHRLFGWIRGHRRVRMEVYNQGAGLYRYLRLSSFPGSARALSRELGSPRFAASPPELPVLAPRSRPAGPPPGELQPPPSASSPGGG